MTKPKMILKKEKVNITNTTYLTGTIINEKNLIDYQDIYNIYVALLKKGIKNDDIQIKALNVSGWTSLKSFTGDILTLDDFDDEYFQNQPEEVKDKWNNFYKFEILFSK